MYVINNFFYGHELANNPTVNEFVHEFDIEFRKHINKKDFEVSTPYHGGQVAGDVCSVFFGTHITDDDGNKLFSQEIRAAKAEDYEKDYETFLAAFVENLKESIGEYDTEDFGKTYNEGIEKLIQFLKDTKPDFYTVESSS